MCSGRVGSSCSASDTLRVNIVTNPVITHIWGKDQEVLATSGTYKEKHVAKIKKVQAKISVTENNYKQAITHPKPKVNSGPPQG